MTENVARRRALEAFRREHGRRSPDGRHTVADCPRCGASEVEFGAVRTPGGVYRVVCRHCVAIVRAAA
jgi:transcription elongation factor Elf1